MFLRADLNQTLGDLILCWGDGLNRLIRVEVEELAGHLLHVWESLESHWHLRFCGEYFTVFKVQLLLVVKVSIACLPLAASQSR
jgi:hypothetical protein